MQDLEHLCEASGVGFELQLPRVPFAAGLERACAELAVGGTAPALRGGAMSVDARALALAGGEDYELLFTVPAGVKPPFGTHIGTATSASGIVLLDANGRQVPPPARPGFDHFAAR
jgi:thiamine-monophosphate kinase